MSEVTTHKLPNLKIEGHEGMSWNLRRFLIKGAAGIDARWFYRNATDDTWQAVIADRIPFIKAISRHLNAEHTRGIATTSIETHLAVFQTFMRWVDANDIPILFDEKTLKTAFIYFDEYQFLRAWGNKEIKPSTAYYSIFTVAQMLTKTLKLPKHLELRHSSRVLKAYKSSRKVSVSSAAEKQHLYDTQILGHYCVDVANSLTIEAISGQLPIMINTLKPDGSTQTYQYPIGLTNQLKGTSNSACAKAKKACAPKACVPYKDSDVYRRGLITTRLLTELVIFVYQTGMSISQVLKIQRQGFSYKLQGNSDWLVTEYKGRAGGSVSFTIYKKYKERIKCFIAFINHFYPDDPFLFPLGSKGSKDRGRINYTTLTNVLKRDGIPWHPPRVTRNTRVNLLDRQIGDPNISAEMAQHTKEIFVQNYDRPSQQRAMGALRIFWKQNPISLINSGCEGKPEATEDKPSEVIKPNCINESGCLWCKSHRDIESEDYVWSLASFRKLKLIEAARPLKREIPADLVVNRLSEKLKAFENLGDQSRRWTEEALLRIDEGRYHPAWKNIINFWEPK